MTMADPGVSIGTRRSSSEGLFSRIPNVSIRGYILSKTLDIAGSNREMLCAQSKPVYVTECSQK